MRRVGAEMCHAGGRTDMTQLTVTFLNFSNAPKNKYRTHKSFVELLEYSLEQSKTVLEESVTSITRVEK